MKAPLRRRSLYTPGLATRSPADLLRKPPTPGQQAEQAVGHSYHMAVPPLLSVPNRLTMAASRHPSAAASQDGRFTPEPFNQLGGLQLGTLRITNDERGPSPTPSNEYHPHQSSSIPGRTSQENYDYYTASEGNKSEDDLLSMGNRARRDTSNIPRRSNSPLKNETQWESVISQRQSDPSPSEPSSPNRRDSRSEFQLGSNHDDHGQHADYFSSLHVDPQSSNRASEIAEDYRSELPQSPYNSSPSSTSQAQRGGDQSATDDWVPRASQFPRALVQDERLSAADVGSSSRDIWQSSITAEAEARHAQSETTEDAYRILNGEVVPSRVRSNQRTSFSGDRDSHDRRTSSSTANSNDLATSQGSSGDHAPTQNAAAKPMYANNLDSGYISRNDSAKSLQGALCFDPASCHETLSQRQCAISGLRGMPQQLLRGPEAGADVWKQSFSNASCPPALEVVSRPPTSITRVHFNWASIHQSDPVATTESSPTIPSTLPSPSTLPTPSPLPSHLSVLNVETPKRDTVGGIQQLLTPQQPAPSAIASPTRGRKLQKASKIPKAIDMTAVQPYSQLAYPNVPMIPHQLAEQHAAREDDFPIVDYTSTGFEPEESKATNSSNIETPHTPISFPSPTNSMEEKVNSIMREDLDWPTKTKRKKKESPHSSIRFPSPTNTTEEKGKTIMREDIEWPARSKKRNKSKEAMTEQTADNKSGYRRMSQGEALAEIADFGTVINSIGSSPYDAAKPPEPARSRASSANTRYHPHQIGSDKPSPKNTNGMDDAEAMALRFRNLFNDSEGTLVPKRLSRANAHDPGAYSDHESRPQSMYAGSVSYALVGEAFERVSRSPGPSHSSHSHENARPRSMFVDVPPVPSLPSANEAQHLEALARRARQVDVPVVQAATSNDRPARLVRPKSMYDSSASTAQYYDWNDQHLAEHSIAKRRLDRPQSMLQEASADHRQSTRPNVGRSETSIHHGNQAPRPKRPQTPHSIVRRRMPPQDELTGHDAATPARPDLHLSDSTFLHGSTRQGDDAEMTDVGLDLSPNKLSKRRLQSVKPDVWKSDSLSNKLKQGDAARDEQPSTNVVRISSPPADVAQERYAADSGAANETRSRRRRSDGEALRPQSSYGMPSVNRFSRPVPAPSLYDALRVCGAIAPNSSAVSPMPVTPHDISGSPVSPISTTNGPPKAPGERRSYFPPAPTRQAPSSPPDNSKRASGVTTKSKRSAAPTEVSGILVGDMDVFPEPPDPTLDGWEYNNKTKRWKHNKVPPPPRTPGRLISLNHSPSEGTSPPKDLPLSTRTPPSKQTSPSKETPPSKQVSPIISVPTATAADSYTSHAGPAPAPPAFSIARKRLSGRLNCFYPTPSARSLKPVCASPEPDMPARPAPPSASRTSSYPTLYTSGETTEAIPSSNTSISAYPQQNGSPERHANGLSSHPTYPAESTPPTPPPKTEPAAAPAPTTPQLPPPVAEFSAAPIPLENLSGRYGGGYQYGYEPGVGLGGSAGTRVPKTGASRKSVDVGKAHGLDLSDIPIYTQRAPLKPLETARR